METNSENNVQSSIQPVNQVPVGTTRQTKNKKGLLLTVLSVLVLLLIVGVGAYFLGKNQAAPKNGNRNLPVYNNKTTSTDVSTGTTMEKKTYTNGTISFKYPSEWTEAAVQVQGSSSLVPFTIPGDTYTFEFMTIANYNNGTGKEYTDIDEFVGMPYTVKTLLVDGQDARQPLPRAGSEQTSTVYFFSPDKKSIYGLSLEVTNATEANINAGFALFDQIVGTAKLTRGNSN